MQFRVLYTFLGNPSSAVVDSSTAEAARAEFERQHPQITTVSGVEAAPVATWLRILPTTEVNTAFVATLLADPELRVFTDAPSASCPLAERQYAEITGLSISWKCTPPGSVAERDRYAARAIISFSKTLPVPDEFRSSKFVPGRLNSMQLFWSLVAAGWRL